MSDTHFYFFQQVPHGGNKWERGGGKVMTLADSFTWFDWWRCVQVRTSPTTNKLCLVLKIWQSPTSKWEGCWALLLLSRIFFPPSPSCSIQFKIHEIHTCAIVLMIAELALDIFYHCSFFFGVTLSKFQHICQRKRTHILPMIFVNNNFCLPDVNFLSTLTSTWSINHCKHIKVGKF